jgi:histidinol-phosphatase
VTSKELQAALDAAEAAAVVIRSLYQRNLTVHTKADATPVTEADVQSEQAIRALLTERFPGYGFYGEETGQQSIDAESVWLVDPIDGTKSFVRECPFFSTQIALMRAGRFVLGVSSAPAYGEVAWAEEGRGAHMNGRPIHVSKVAALSGAIVSSGNLKTLARSGAWSRYGDLVGHVNRIRGYGDFVHYHLLARGSLDVVIESDVGILDIAALTVIVREAGGTFTDLHGGEVGLNTTSVLATNGLLHANLQDRREIQLAERCTRQRIASRPFYPAAVAEQQDHTICEARRQRRVMERRDDRAAGVRLRAEQLQHRDLMMRVEMIRRLIQQEDVRRLRKQ